MEFCPSRCNNTTLRGGVPPSNIQRNRHGGNSKRRIAGFAIASLVIAGVVGVTSLSVSGQTPSPPPTVPYATLTINITDRAGSVTLELLDGKTYNQSILTTQPCATLALGPITDGTDTYPGTLLDFTPIAGSGASVQIPGDGIGVESGQNCGTPAGLLGPGEKLQMSLGTFAAYDTNEDTVGNEVTVGSASLEIGGRVRRPEGPQGQFRLRHDRVDVPGRGRGVHRSGRGVHVEHHHRIDGEPEQPGLSLRGQTSFALVAPIPYAEAVFCSDDPVPAEDVAETGPAAQDATFTRGDNNAAGGGVTQEGCDDIGVTLQIDEDGVFLDKGTVGIFTGEPQDVNATLEITWTPLDPENATWPPTSIERSTSSPKRRLLTPETCSSRCSGASRRRSREPPSLQSTHNSLAHRTIRSRATRFRGVS